MMKQKELIDLLNSKVPFYSSANIVSNTPLNRGIAVYKVNEGSTPSALKVFFSDQVSEDSNLHQRKNSLEKEIDAYQSIGFLKRERYISSGHNNEAIWLETRWIEGDTVSEYFRKAESKLVNHKELLTAGISIISSLKDLHNEGYLHRDVHTKNILIKNEHNVNFLDFDQYQEIGKQDQFYKGGLVHFNSPNICQQILGGNGLITYSLSDEIFSLSITLYYLLTGKIPYSYQDNIKRYSYEEILSYIANGVTIPYAQNGFFKSDTLDLFFQKSLNKNVEERISTLSDFEVFLIKAIEEID